MANDTTERASAVDAENNTVCFENEALIKVEAKGIAHERWSSHSEETGFVNLLNLLYLFAPSLSSFVQMPSFSPC